jgi:hypothetical protein
MTYLKKICYVTAYGIKSCVKPAVSAPWPLKKCNVSGKEVVRSGSDLTTHQ